MVQLQTQEVKMFHCHVCGSSEANEDFTDEVFLIDGKRILVEHIPVTRCARCGEPTFSRATTGRVRKSVYSRAQPIRTVPLEVFAFA
jgi:YgiT-type zinc finger domain-containing protein